MAAVAGAASGVPGTTSPDALANNRQSPTGRYTGSLRPGRGKKKTQSNTNDRKKIKVFLKKSSRCLKPTRFNVQQQVAEVAESLQTGTPRSSGGTALLGGELPMPGLAEEDRAPLEPARPPPAPPPALPGPPPPPTSPIMPRAVAVAAVAPRSPPAPLPAHCRQRTRSGGGVRSKSPNVRWWPGWQRSAPSSEIARPSRKGRRSSRLSARPAAAARPAPGAPLRVSPLRFSSSSPPLSFPPHPSPPFPLASFPARSLTHPPARPPPPCRAA